MSGCLRSGLAWVQGGFPIDLILFGMIAAFLVLRLRSILGRRDGFEPTQAPARPRARRRAGDRGPCRTGGRARPRRAGRRLGLGQTLASMRRVDDGFDPQAFLAGAEAAFRMIVTAFAAGDRDALRPLLTAETFADFEGAIAAREAAGETQTSEIRGESEAAIEAPRWMARWQRSPCGSCPTRSARRWTGTASMSPARMP